MTEAAAAEDGARADRLRLDDGREADPDFQPAVPDHAERVAALDGIRALAVTAVLLYHAGMRWAQGGFLGVDVFFVLSGYLITGLLAGEYLRTGRISLTRFYRRRARRLLPALFIVIAAVCAYTVFRLPQEASTLRSDSAASLGYVTNWWFIDEGTSYFASLGRPSLLLHLWSLAVEEQFYLLWPLCLLLLLRGAPGGLRTLALWRALGGAVVLAVASAGLMAGLYAPGRDPSRIYYGTDTRAFEILIGVILALAVTARSAERRDAERPPAPNAQRGWSNPLSGAALAAIVAAFVLFRSSSSSLYPWGLIGVCVMTAVLIQVAASGGAVASFFALRPMVWLGERSYTLYLWHWPVFDLTRPKADVSWSSPMVFLVRVAVSLVLTEVTYRLIERPVRRGALGRVKERFHAEVQARRYGFPASVATSVVGVGVVAALVTGGVVVTADRHPANRASNAIDTAPGLSLLDPEPSSSASADLPSTSFSPTSAPASTSTTSPAPGATGKTGSTVPPRPTAVPTKLPPVPASPLAVTFVGDSEGLSLVLNRPTDTARYLTVTDGTTMGCGLLLGRISSRSGAQWDLGYSCASALNQWASAVAANHPQVAIVVAGGWDVYDDQVNGADLTFGTPAWDQNYRTRLATVVDRLKAAGAPKVALSLAPCYRPPAESTPGFSLERGDDYRTAHIDALLSDYAATTPGVAALIPPPQFCTDPKISTDPAYRVDGIHYYKAGAKLYFQTAIAQLFAQKP